MAVDHSDLVEQTTYPKQSMADPPTYNEVVHSQSHSRQSSLDSGSDLEAVGKSAFSPQPNYPGFFLSSSRHGPKDKDSPNYCCGCCGSKVCIYLLVLAAIIAAAILGGVFGHRALTHRDSSSSSNSTVPMATVPAYIDASPTVMPLGTNIAETGPKANVVPSWKAKQSTSCLANSTSTSAWGCTASWNSTLQLATSTDVNPQMRQLEFVPKSGDTNATRYGPQTPHFDTASFVLAPFDDNDGELGSAFMTWFRHDKLVILPESFFASDGASNYSQGLDQPLSIGDRPFYCWWNQTVSELFIYASAPYQPTPEVLSDGSTNYPDLVKIREKYVPSVSEPPACQQMQVMNDWQVMSLEGSEVFDPETSVQAHDYCQCVWYNKQFSDDSVAPW